MHNAALSTYLIPAAAMVWIIYRQFVGRFVTRGMVLPLILVGWGLVEVVQADIRWGTLAVLVVASARASSTAVGAYRAFCCGWSRSACVC